MGEASYAVGSFLGGEISQFAQGRFDKPDYRTSLKTSLNAYPIEAGSHVRRPGSRHAGPTRGGVVGRTIKFDFEQAAAVTLEFTDRFLRFRNGAALVTGNDSEVVVAVSAANPAVVQTTNAVTWATGDTLVFPGASTPLLENRQFLATKVNTTHFSLADAITGTAIDGATLGALTAGATVARVHEVATVYAGTQWSTVRAVQAETTAVLLSSGYAPQALNVTTLPNAGINPAFSLATATLNDGPYLDPFTNGVLATPSAKVGIINLTLSFPAYSATKAYAVGQFVTSVGVNYISIADQNVGNVPAGSPTKWTAVDASAAINDGRGFLATDISRQVRLYSEPAAWSSAATYNLGDVIGYNPTGLPGATTFWTSLVGTNTNHVPGTDLTNWQIIASGAAMWSWGKITSLLNTIAGNPASVVHIGDMTSGGGLAAAFNGTTSQNGTASASRSTSGSNVSSFTFTSYVGQNFSGCVTTAYAIQSATVFPSTDLAVASAVLTYLDPSATFTIDVTARLYGSNSAPASATNGTLLGTTTQLHETVGLASGTSFTLGASPITILSSDQTTTYKYLWAAVTLSITQASGFGNISTYSANEYVAQLILNAAPGSGSTSAGVAVEILGPPLLFTTSMVTWRLGVFSDTTGWPTCGTYYEGRIWLGGAVANRFDACVSNGVSGSTINFAPTDQYGAVAASNAISYTLNSDGVNQILWMDPDLQGVKMGTQAGEWLVVAPTAGPIAPANISARNVTKHGSANIQPCRTEHTTVFVQRFAKKLLEYFPDVFSGKFSAPNLADKAQHIVRAGVAELAYTSAVNPIIWGRDALGALFGITYKRDSLASAQPPTYYGWHRHTLGSGRTVESLCSGPSTGGDLDALTMVTNDATTGIRHVEVLTDAPDELSALANAWFLDNAASPTSITSTLSGGTYGYGQLTLNGLWHLNGKTVQVFAAGLDCGDRGDANTAAAPLTDFVVANGSITIPYGDSISTGPGKGLLTADFIASIAISQIVVGFTYTSDGQLVHPISQADSGARNGPAFGKLSRAHRYALKLVNTLGLSVGGTFAKVRPANFKNTNNSPLAALTTFTGISQDVLEDDFDYDRGLCWRVTRPFPANVVVAGVNLATKDQ